MNNCSIDDSCSMVFCSRIISSPHLRQFSISHYNNIPTYLQIILMYLYLNWYVLIAYRCRGGEHNKCISLRWVRINAIPIWWCWYDIYKQLSGNPIWNMIFFCPTYVGINCRNLGLLNWTFISSQSVATAAILNFVLFKLNEANY